MYGKQTETAIAAVSYLATLWEGPSTRRVSAADIADGRGLQRPFVAKLLSSLSQAGIVDGSPGPGGGYALAKNPNEICLRDVWLLFERPDSSRVAFVGSEICGVSVPNDLSDRIGRVEQAMNSLLDETTFDVFCGKTETLTPEMPAIELSKDRQAC
ncbi:MAG: Rrf2 family transcriptional regulator [Phycisphaera sp. TMED9]|nr:MAG: Rrf2 family transcriptional regulator [Phycisphaera sp. TMED9]